MSKTKTVTYTNVENEIIDDEIIFDIYEKMILITLLRYAKKNEAYPSLNTLAKKVKCNKSTIARKLNHLEELKLIERKQRYSVYGRKKSTLYTIVDIREFLQNFDEGMSHSATRVCRTERQGYVAQNDKGMSHCATSNTLTTTTKTITNITKKYSSSLSLNEFMNKYDISKNYEKALLGISSKVDVAKIEEVYLHAVSKNSIKDKVAYTIATLKNIVTEEDNVKEKSNLRVEPLEMVYDWINDCEREV